MANDSSPDRRANAGELDSDHNPVAVGSFRDELREMPTLQRWVIYATLFCTTLLMLQCLFIMPVILIKYGWGFDLSGDGS